jgi:hypothetical protein
MLKTSKWLRYSSDTIQARNRQRRSIEHKEHRDMSLRAQRSKKKKKGKKRCQVYLFAEQINKPDTFFIF